MKLFYCLLCLVCCLVACSQDTVESPSPQLVVEGWIENGEYPVVKVTTKVPVSDSYLSEDSLSRYVLKWAKVTISDGEREVVLTGRYTKRHFPPYVFSTYDMQGEEGRTYTLKVLYGRLYAEATTTIPRAVLLDSLRVIERSSPKGTYGVKAYIDDPEDESNYYMFMMRADLKKDEFYPSYLGLVNDSLMTHEGFFVNRGQSNLKKKYTSYYLPKETVDIKLLHLDRQAFKFWESYAVLTDYSRVPGLHTQHNIRGNVKGAWGYWWGYGVSRYRITMPD